MLHDRHHIVFWNVILKFLFKLYVTLITFVNNNNNKITTVNLYKINVINLFYMAKLHES